MNDAKECTTLWAVRERVMFDRKDSVDWEKKVIEHGGRKKFVFFGGGEIITPLHTFPWISS